MEFALGGMCLIIALLSINLSMCFKNLCKALDEINKTLKNLKK